MGRRSSRTRAISNNYRQAGRDVVKHTPIARQTIRLPRLTKTDLRVFEDRRTFHPDWPVRPAYSLPRSSARLIVGKGIVVGKPNVNVSRKDPVDLALRGTLPHRIGFEVPKDVVNCVRRKRRREVMHALGKAGRGGVGRGKRRRTNEFSEVQC